MKRPDIGAIALILFLGIMLLGVGYFAYEGLTVGEGPVPNDFYIAMTLGVVFSLVVGVGLMALVFYSSRKGYDEPPSFRE
jgi:cation transporter-like permease